MTNPTNTQEDELRRIVESHMYLYAHATTPEARTRLVRKILALISNQREQAYSEGWNARNELPEEAVREQARQELLDELAAKADAEYSRSGIDNWLFALGNHVHDAILQSKRATLKGDKK